MWVGSDCQPPGVDLGRASQFLRYRDPVYLTTTRDAIYLQWNYNFQCVGDASGSHDMYWLTGSGWYRGSHYTYPLDYDFNGYWVRGKGNSFYYNSSFPGCGETVYANHSKNEVYGISDGKAGFSWDLYLLGSNCQTWLTPVIEQENY